MTTVSASTDPTLTQYINLANYVYTSGQQAFSGSLIRHLGYKPLTGANGKIVKELDTTTGLYGEAFVSTGAGPKQVIVAYEGTNLSHHPPSPVFSAAQVADDLLLYEGLKPLSFDPAVSFAQQAISAAASKGISQSNVFVDGHSLGAAEAEYVSAKTGLNGVSFGTPGVSIVWTLFGSGTMTNYVEQGDPVGNYAADAPDYLGSIVKSSLIRHYGQTDLVGNPTNSTLLKDAGNLYGEGDFVGALADLALATRYHHLTQYASDLNVKLYGNDGSNGSDSTFFNPVGGGSSSKLSQHVEQLALSLFEGALSSSGTADSLTSSAFANIAAALAAATTGHHAHRG